MIPEQEAHEIPNLRVSPLVAVVIHNVQIKNYFPLVEQSRENEGRLNRDTDRGTARQCLCVQALPKILDELVTQRK